MKKKLCDSVAMVVIAVACFAGVSGVAQAGIADDYQAPSIMTSETFSGTVMGIHFFAPNARGDSVSAPAEKAASVQVLVKRDTGGTLVVTQLISGPTLNIGDAVKVVSDVAGLHIAK